MIRCYSELSKLKTFKERYDYLKLDGVVGEDTFGFDRYLNQALYASDPWKQARREVIRRDDGCDLGLMGYDIPGLIVVHHMNPMTIKDIEEDREWIFDPEFLICVSLASHKAIHYGDEDSLPIYELIERTPGDTKLW